MQPFFLDQIDQVQVIQVIWSDQENSVPGLLKKKYDSNKVHFELHSSDRLSNRFRAITPPPTEV
jgi:hypothetical protein